MAPSTLVVIHRHLATIFRAAVNDRLIAVSPCRGIRLPKVEPKRIEPLATEAVRALIDNMPDRYQALVVLAAGTGTRQGECFGVALDRVDFMRRSITVDQQLTSISGSPPFLAPPKTSASHRVIPLPDVVLEALSRHLKAYPVENDLGLVFTTPSGGPIRKQRFVDIWRRAVVAASLPRGTGFHQLRHYYASLLIHHGESVKVVQTRLGHARAGETLDVYSHLWPSSEDSTRAAIDAVLGSSRGQTADIRGASSL